MKKENMFKFLNIIVGIGVIAAALIGIFYSTGGQRFTAINMYGNKVELYGDGIYAFNSVFTVANRLGSDVVDIIIAIILIILTFRKRRSLSVKVIQTSVVICLADNLACLVFGISMNRLYFLYVICFGISLFIAIIYVQDLMKSISVPETLKNQRLTGTGIFLIAVGVITMALWCSSIIPAMINNTYGSLLGVQTTEVTYGIDLSITCPIFIMCGIWILKKKDIGYKIAPLLLSIIVLLGILVISARVYCSKLGINIPLAALIGFIISFVIMGIISLYLLIKLMMRLKKI